MVDIGLYVVLGFLAASLLALMLVPSFWNRAVRLTRRRIEATMPMSVADIQADKDQLRAQFAIELRRLEVRLDRARDKAARELVETNKRRVEIARLRSDADGLKGRLQERDNANRVLEQTIRRRLPELESRVKSAKEAIAALEGSNHDLRNANLSQAEALKLARATINVQRSDVDQLRATLEVVSAPPRRPRSVAALADENKRLSTELSKLKEEFVQGTIGGRENELLRGEIGKLARQILAVAKAQGTPLPTYQEKPAAPLESADEIDAAPQAAALGVSGSVPDEAQDTRATKPEPELEVAAEETEAELEPVSEDLEESIETVSDDLEEELEPATDDLEEEIDSVAEDVEEEPAAPLAAKASEKLLFSATSDDFSPPQPEPEKRGSLAQILAARKEKRRSTPPRRTSLADRLKGVRAEASDG